MSIESSIITRLRESRDQEFMTYKGFTIASDDDNNIIVKGNRGKIGEFISTDDAIEYIDNLPASQRYSQNKKPDPSSNQKGRMYLIFLKGTYYDSRAKFLRKKTRRCDWSYERDADQFTEKEMNAILRNSRNYDSLLVR